VPDVDGDGRADTEFYSEQPRFEFGVRTASGALIVLRDDLAGPAVHAGWIHKGPSGAPLAVLDDSRTATLHALVGCRFVTPDGVNGKPYAFTLNGFGDAGTGVTCTAAQDDSWLSGVLAERRSNGRYDIIRTRILVSADGRTATNGDRTTVATGLDRSDPRVQAAMTSVCPGVPEVRTSGR
jgi:hypothetical protein